MILDRGSLLFHRGAIGWPTMVTSVRCSRSPASRESALAWRLKRESYVIQKIEDPAKAYGVMDDRELVAIHEPQMIPLDEQYDKHRSVTSQMLRTTNNKLIPRWTEWRVKHAARKARHKLSMPVSLTGLGDGVKTQYWVSRMREIADKLENEITKGQLEKQAEKDNEFMQSLTPSMKLLIEEDKEGLRDKYPNFFQKLEEEKSKALQAKLADTSVEPYRPHFPYLITRKIQEEVLSATKSENQEIDKESPHSPSGLIDQDYQTYLKHHNMVQHFAQNMKVLPEEYDAEIDAMTETVWRRNYGFPDPRVPPSQVPCGGCGAFLHCVDANIPGYMPSERFKKLNKNDLLTSKCVRCEMMAHFNVALNVSVDPNEYPELIAKIQTQRALVVLMVDLLDFPCSIWPGIVQLIGTKRKIFVVGNKVDLLPKDSHGYMQGVRKSVIKSLIHAGIDFQTCNIQNMRLISAKTGYGVEALITDLMNSRHEAENIYLIGCTNVGKSTLFNALMQSDLCKLREGDLLTRATTSVWPGTTLKLLRFPIHKPNGLDLELRNKRIRFEQRLERQENRLRQTLYRQTKNPQYAQLSGRIVSTFRSNCPFTVESGHPYAKRKQHPRPFDCDHPSLKNAKFVCDTPGTIYKDQLLTLLTAEELLLTIPREIITPRTFTIRPGQTLFIAGLARLDVVSAPRNFYITVFASNYLPIHIVYTHEAVRFYELFLGSDLLKVPIGGPDSERLKYWPPLRYQEFEAKGVSFRRATCDIVLSSAGWASVHLDPEHEAVFRAYTPEGRGLHKRDPPLLSFAHYLRGKRIPKTPCYESKCFTIDDYDSPEHQKAFNQQNYQRIL